MWVEFGVKQHMNSNAIFRRFPCPANKQHSYLEQLKCTYNNIDIYKSIFEYDSPNIANANIRGPLCFDFDNLHLTEDNYNDIRRQILSLLLLLQEGFKIPENKVQIFFSGYKGFHIIVDYKLFGFQYQNSQLVQNYKKIAIAFKDDYKLRWGNNFIDTAIYDSRRVLRVPNTINYKGQLYKIHLTWQEFREMSLTEVKELAQKPREYYSCPFVLPIKEARRIYDILMTEIDISNQHNIHISNKKNMLPCIKNLLNHSISEGQRNNVTVALASSLYQAGYDSNEVRDILILWNNNNVPPLPEYEVISTMLSAKNMIDNNKAYGCTRIKELGLCTNCNLNGYRE